MAAGLLGPVSSSGLVQDRYIIGYVLSSTHTSVQKVVWAREDFWRNILQLDPMEQKPCELQISGDTSERTCMFSHVNVPQDTGAL